MSQSATYHVEVIFETAPTDKPVGKVGMNLRWAVFDRALIVEVHGCQRGGIAIPTPWGRSSFWKTLSLVNNRTIWNTILAQQLEVVQKT